MRKRSTVDEWGKGGSPVWHVWKQRVSSQAVCLSTQLARWVIHGNVYAMCHGHSHRVPGVHQHVSSCYATWRTASILCVCEYVNLHVLEDGKALWSPSWLPQISYTMDYCGNGAPTPPRYPLKRRRVRRTGVLDNRGGLMSLYRESNSSLGHPVPSLVGVILTCLRQPSYHNHNTISLNWAVTMSWYSPEWSGRLRRSRSDGVSIKISIIWSATPCSLAEVCRRFRCTCILHEQQV